MIKVLEPGLKSPEFVESPYDDTGLPSAHGRATRSVYTTHTPILSLCVLLSATLLFNCDSGELELAPPYSLKLCKFCGGAW